MQRSDPSWKKEKYNSTISNSIVVIVDIIPSLFQTWKKHINTKPDKMTFIIGSVVCGLLWTKYIIICVWKEIVMRYLKIEDVFIQYEIFSKVIFHLRPSLKLLSWSRTKDKLKNNSFIRHFNFLLLYYLCIYLCT